MEKSCFLIIAYNGRGWGIATDQCDHNAAFYSIRHLTPQQNNYALRMARSSRPACRNTNVATEEQNPYASRTHQVFNLPKFSHVTLLFHDLTWLLVITPIRFKTLVLAYKAVSGTTPTYHQTLVRS